MQPIIAINDLSKTYSDGYEALKNVNLTIQPGEILALLGPNGAGKTTLISIICGIVNASKGTVSVDGHDIVDDYRLTRSKIGLVPQELTLGSFEKVWSTLCFSRGLFAKKPDTVYLEQILKDLSLWDKKDSMLMSLSGGMKRRVLIAKALAHEPMILFLDEPTAGVDVELRQDMWALIRRLQKSGVTIILTTHYIEEAEAIADRVGIINQGELLLVDDKQALMHKLGKRQLIIELDEVLKKIPERLSESLSEPFSKSFSEQHSEQFSELLSEQRSKQLQVMNLDLSEDGLQLTYTYDPNESNTGINNLLQLILESGLSIKDVQTNKTSLEEIFVNLVKRKK